jgi:hypothetical protein
MVNVCLGFWQHNTITYFGLFFLKHAEAFKIYFCIFVSCGAQSILCWWFMCMCSNIQKLLVVAYFIINLFYLILGSHFTLPVRVITLPVLPCVPCLGLVSFKLQVVFC